MTANTRGERLRAARAKRFKSARAAAIAFGLPISTYGAHERAESQGGRDYGPEEARRYGRRLGVTPEWLLTGHQSQAGEHADTPSEQPAMTLRILGYVGAGAQVHLYKVNPENLDEVELGGLAMASTVALEIRDSSNIGLKVKNWLLLYEDLRREPTPDLIGELCVVAYKDGRIIVQQMREGAGGVLWAAAIKAMIRR